MARQKGPIPLVGRIGDLSFYEDKVHGYLIRRKGGPSKKQISKKKSMEQVRQNNSEFGRSSSYGALLRGAFRPLVLHCKEYSMSRRLQALLLSVIKMDEGKEAGKRDVLNEHMVALQGFELNEAVSYRRFFKKDVDIEVSKMKVIAKGSCTIPASIARRAEFYKIISVAATVDFGKKRFTNEVKESKMAPCKESKSFVFEHRLSEPNCLFYGLVICFYEKDGKVLEMIQDDGMKAGFISFVSAGE